MEGAAHAAHELVRQRGRRVRRAAAAAAARQARVALLHERQADVQQAPQHVRQAGAQLQGARRGAGAELDRCAEGRAQASGWFPERVVGAGALGEGPARRRQYGNVCVIATCASPCNAAVCCQ